MITRRIGMIVRGSATPFQLMAACVLGAMLGFLPGFTQAAGAMLAVILLLIMLNANLPLAALVAVGSKLLALLLTPVSFAVGRLLLDGPAGGLFQALINAPVLALFGFEYYVTTGGLALGLVVGVITGWLVVQGITRFRRKMAGLEQTSERYQRYHSRKSVRFLIWLLAGSGKGKVSYEELLAKRVGNPIRMLGVVFAALVVLVAVLVQQLASGPILRAGLQRGLERVNGATVDVEEVDLDLGSKRLTVRGLALADPNALDQDLFRAATIEADVSARNLWRKRLELDRVVITEASTGEGRRVPGTRIGPAPRPAPDIRLPDVKTIEDYLRNAQVWKERLTQARQWLEKISGPEPDSDAPEEAKETLRERLEREVREKGYAQVRATHLIEGSPTFTVTELRIEKMRSADLPDETFDITARNLSTHPNLLGRAPEIDLRSSAESIAFRVAMGQFAATPTNNLLAFAWRGLPTDQVAGNLVIAGQQPIRGGTIDLGGEGHWTTRDGVTVDLPLQATLHNVNLTLPTGDPVTLDQFVLPIALSGPLDNPRIQVDDSGLTQALLAAGKQRAVSELQDRAADLLEKQVGGQVGEQGRGLLNNIIGGQRREP